mgnify:CR=1 FL=1
MLSGASILTLEEVVPTQRQAEELYSQLEARRYNISHSVLPDYENHIKFLNNNPYRAWFLIKVATKFVGNIYVQFDNSIGLHCNCDIPELHIKAVLDSLLQRLAPLEVVPSARSKNYFLNVASSNLELQKKLINIGLTESQRSFIFAKKQGDS